MRGIRDPVPENERAEPRLPVTVGPLISLQGRFFAGPSPRVPSRHSTRNATQTDCPGSTGHVPICTVTGSSDLAGWGVRGV